METDAFFTCLAELRQGRPCVLATILRRDGSAPRDAGATMAVLENGRTVGTVGGGALEYQTVQRAMTCLRERRSALPDYRLAPGASSLDMVCGGNVTVLCHFVAPEDENARSTLAAMEAAGKDAGSMWLVRRVRTGEMSIDMGLYAKGDGKDRDSGVCLAGGGAEPPVVPAALLGRRAALTEGPETLFVQPLRLAGHAYVFGGGHVAQRLVPLLKELEFSPVVVEDRPEFATRERFPQAEAIILGSFASIGDSLTLAPEDAAVIMTRGHAYDDLLLNQVLRSPAWYVGLMGSRSKVAATRAYLLGQGFSEADIARLHTPIGLAIGAETPAEIAVSVAGEMVLCRASLLPASDQPRMP